MKTELRIEDLSSINITKYTVKSVKTSPVISEEDKEKILNFHNSFKQKESKVFSQNKEDGVIIALLQFLKIKTAGYYVEFGTESCSECNTRNLRENHNWKGIIITL